MRIMPWILTFAVLAVVGTLLLCTLTACGDTGPKEKSPIDGARAFSHVKAMVDFGPRPAGTAALRQNRDYIVDELKKLGLTPKVDSFEDPAKAPGITFHNIECEIAGTKADEKRIVILGSHYDTKKTDVPDRPSDGPDHFVGANDAASSSGLLIELARWLVANPLPCPTLLLWFDGEESISWEWGSGDRALFGSKHAADKLSRRFDRKLGRNVIAMVLLDMVGAKDLHIVEDTDSSPDLIALFKATAKDLGYDKHFFKSSLPVTDDHVPFKQRGVRVIDLIQFGGKDQNGVSPWWHTHEDTLDILSPDSLSIVGHVVVRALPKIVAEAVK
ncbi:MAG: M28 family peptidase [Planctomycetes bacterium]|nr:M28 family peptidase [Planctomycetota bacterium]